MGKKYIMLCMVGTSAVGNTKEKNCEYYFDADDRYISAEAQSTCIWARHDAEEDSELEIYMFPSLHPRCIYTAECARQDILEKYKRKFLSRISNLKKIEIQPLDIKVDNKEHFFNSFENIFNAFDRKIRAYESFDNCEIIINATGGYKSITAYAAIYAQLHNLKSIYTYEDNRNSTESVILPPLPVSYSLKMMDEEITMLKYINESPKLFSDTDFNTLPVWLHGFLKKENGNIKAHPLANALVEEYRKQKDNVEIGSGLLSILEEAEKKYNSGTKFSSYLRCRINKQWSDLWLGDQIPETVEHSRRHSKRLMEICANIFRAAEASEKDQNGKNMLEALGFDKPVNIALLIASFFLHDIGHTVIAYPFAEPDKDFADNIFPIGKFPSCVREIHHLLSAELIKTCRDHYFCAEKDGDRNIADMFGELVPMICAHHRQYMTLSESEKDVVYDDDHKVIEQVTELVFGDERKEFEHPLETRIKCVINGDKYRDVFSAYDIDVKEICNVAALLRFIDACDVQMDRTAGKNFMRTRQYRTKEEALSLWPILNALSGGDKNISLPDEANKLHEILKDIKQDSIKLDGAKSKEIKENCTKIYGEVLNNLNKIKKNSGNCSITAENAAKMEFLSALNRFAFKCEQFRHFYKHSCVDFVFPTLSEDKKSIVINLWPNKEYDDKKTVNKICDDINEEYNKVSGLLGVLKISACCR